MSVVDVPSVVQAKARAVGAGAWLDALPGLLDDLEREWSISVGGAFGDATEAYVAEATLWDGTPAVLKLVVPRDVTAAAYEIAVLRRCAGDGCVTLLRDDTARGAMLLERLGAPLRNAGLSAEQRHEILCDTAARVWRHAPPPGLPTGADKARWLADFIERTWEALGRPCSPAAVAHALESAHRRGEAHDPDRAVLVHGDVHQWNALQADGEVGEYRLVDPDGLEAEPEYDLGVIMREDPVELLEGDPGERARRLAGRTGLDAQAVWEWGVVERVSTGLLGTSVGLQPIARQMLRAADAVAGRGVDA
jgi:streptomycin 6-kinase